MHSVGARKFFQSQIKHIPCRSPEFLCTIFVSVKTNVKILVGDPSFIRTQKNSCSELWELISFCAYGLPCLNL